MVETGGLETVDVEPSGGSNPSSSANLPDYRTLLAHRVARC